MTAGETVKYAVMEWEMQNFYSCVPENIRNDKDVQVCDAISQFCILLMRKMSAMTATYGITGLVMLKLCHFVQGRDHHEENLRKGDTTFDVCITLMSGMSTNIVTSRMDGVVEDEVPAL